MRIAKYLTEKAKTLFHFAVCMLLPLAGGGGVVVSCANLEDDTHYKQADSEIANEELKIVGLGSREYMAQRGDLSQMNQLFEQQGIYDALSQKGQLSTLLVVTNDCFSQPEGDAAFITRSHVSDISISPANLQDGTRLMMWHGKYVNVSIDSLGREGNIAGHIFFNNGAVREVIKTTTGYIYIISDMIQTPTSLRDYIDQLPAEYSVFRNMVQASGGREFDRAHSKAVGINEQGNTVYDSVFIYTNTFFDAVGFDMNSESLTATLLLCSNQVISDALADAHARLERWQAGDANLGHRTPTHDTWLGCNDSIMLQWILEAAFHRKHYTTEDLSNHGVDTPDLNSIYNRQWRPSMQQVDTQHPIELSNGTVYNVTRLHIPNNVLIYRLKEYFYYYESCTAEQKEQYYKAAGLTYKSCETEVTAWTPWAGVWPTHENRFLRFDKASGVNDDDGFQLDFTPLRMVGGEARPFLVPPGTYRLAMGSVQNAGFDIICSVLANGQEIARSPIRTWGTSTAYHYDRGTTLPNRHPEGYDHTYVREQGGNSKADNYHTDGGLMIEEVEVPDVNGDGSAVPIVLRLRCNNWAGKTNLKLHHWCLRPTVNNY
jgi:hypothetical protein